MSLAIELFERGKGPGDGSVDAFLGGFTFPIIEGDRVTFVWRGEADEVKLWHAIYGLPTFQSFRRVKNTDLWFCIGLHGVFIY